MNTKSKWDHSRGYAVSPITVFPGRSGGRGGAGGAPEGGGTEMFSNKIVYNSGQRTRKRTKHSETVRKYKVLERGGKKKKKKTPICKAWPNEYEFILLGIKGTAFIPA